MLPPWFEAILEVILIPHSTNTDKQELIEPKFGGCRHILVQW